jgi:hypothetical protein
MRWSTFTLHLTEHFLEVLQTLPCDKIKIYELKDASSVHNKENNKPPLFITLGGSPEGIAFDDNNQDQKNESKKYAKYPETNSPWRPTPNVSVVIVHRLVLYFNTFTILF